MRAAPNRVWVTDMTYIWTWEGWLFLAAIVDVFSRRVVGWAMADHLRTELPLEALGHGARHSSARAWPGPPLRPWLPVRERGLPAELAARGIVCSMSRVGDCWDNAVAESFFATLKTELIHRRPWPTKARGQGRRSTTTSGRSTIRTGVTRPSVTSARWTSKGNTLPRVWQHSGTVYGIGSTPMPSVASMRRLSNSFHARSSVADSNEVRLRAIRTWKRTCGRATL